MVNDKPTILVVDDDLTNIQVGIRMLKEVGEYQMIFATSGAQALERVKEHDFDLILLDILMQPMDGFEVCRRLKADKATRHIPVVFLTARTDSDSLIQGFELGGGRLCHQAVQYPRTVRPGQNAS